MAGDGKGSCGYEPPQRRMTQIDSNAIGRGRKSGKMTVAQFKLNRHNLVTILGMRGQWSGIARGWMVPTIFDLIWFLLLIIIAS